MIIFSKLVAMAKPTPDNYRVGVMSIYGNHDKMDITLYYKYLIMVSDTNFCKRVMCLTNKVC